MDEFQYQLYLSKIESLKGTKQPLKELAKEIYKIRDSSSTDIQLLYKKYILIRTIKEYSSAINPLPKKIEIEIKYSESTLLASNDITLEQFKTIYPYTNTSIYFYPSHLSDLNLINDKIKVLNKDQHYIFSCDLIREVACFTDIEIATYLYVKNTIGDSPLLKRIKANLSLDKLNEINQNLETQFNALKAIKQQYEKEQHEYSN